MRPGRGPAVTRCAAEHHWRRQGLGAPGAPRRDPPKVYQTFLQANTGFGQMVLHVRASRDSADIMRPIIAAVQEIARDVPMAPVRTLAAEVDAALVRERFVATLSSLFGLVALALICIGLYGLMAFTVARRTSEIGIRMALGATRSDVRRLVGARRSPSCWPDCRWASCRLDRRTARLPRPLTSALRGDLDRSGHDRLWRLACSSRHDGGRRAAGQARRADRSDDRASRGVVPRREVPQLRR